MHYFISPIQSPSSTPVVSSRFPYDVQRTRNTFRVWDILLLYRDSRYCYVDKTWGIVIVVSLLFYMQLSEDN